MNQHRNGQELRGKHILVVEDHTDTAEMIQLLLEGEGYRVQWAGTARTAYEMLSGGPSSDKLHPDLILLDLTMPEMDPVDMVKGLKPEEKSPIILLSAKPEQAVTKAAEAIGAAGVVQKPFSVADLLDQIEGVLAH